MNWKEELILDFDLHMPRILINGDQAIIDNVKRILVLSEESVIVDCGKRQISVRGTNLAITYLDQERMFLRGKMDTVEFYGESKHRG